MATCKQQRQGRRAAEVKEREMGIGAVRPWFWAVSQHVSFALFFSDAASRLGGAKPRADERPEKVRLLSAGSASNSKVLYGSSVKHFSLVSQVPCGQPLELDEHLR